MHIPRNIYPLQSCSVIDKSEGASRDNQISFNIHGLFNNCPVFAVPAHRKPGVSIRAIADEISLDGYPGQIGEYYVGTSQRGKDHRSVGIGIGRKNIVCP